MISLFRIALGTVVAVTLASCGGVQSEGNGSGGTGGGGTGGTGGTSSTGPSVSLEASRDPVPIEESAVLTWTVSNATECQADGDWFGMKLSAGGNERVWIYKDATFELECTNDDQEPATATVEVSLAGSPVIVSIQLSSYFLKAEQSFVVDVMVSNPGSTPVGDIVVNVELPDIIIINELSLPMDATCMDDCVEGMIEWEPNDVEPGEMAHLSFESIVHEDVLPLAEIPIDVSATAGGEVVEKQEVAEEGDSDLDLVLAQTPAQAAAGDVVEYTLTYTNNGTSELQGVDLIVTLPGPVEVTAAPDGDTTTNGVIVWSVASIAPGGSGVVTATVEVNPTLPVGAQLRAEAGASADGAALRARATSQVAVGAAVAECLTSQQCGPGRTCEDGSCVAEPSDKLMVSMADASSAWSASYTAARSVDGSLGTYWSTAGGAVDGAFINYHFASPVRVTGLRMYASNVTGSYAAPRVATLTFFDAGGAEIESQVVEFNGPYDDWQDVSIAAVSGVSRIELFPTELTAEGRSFLTIHEIEFFGSVLSSTCVQECGVGNPVPGWSTDLQMLECDLMGVPLMFAFNLQGAAQGAVQAGVPNTFDLSLQTVMPVSLVNLFLNLTDSASFESATGTIVATGGTTDVNTVPLALNGTPCDVCFEPDNAVVTQFPQTTGSWTLDSGNQQELTLADVSMTLDAAGLEILLTTIGADPTCAWTTAPPALTFTAP